MRKIFEVLRWEFWTHFRSRTFLISTLFSPLLLSLMILLPSLFLQEQGENVAVVGIVNFSEARLEAPLARELNRKYKLDSGGPKYFLIRIRVDTVGELAWHVGQLQQMGAVRDSLDQEYRVAKAEREKIFMWRPSTKRNRMLKDTYDNFVFIREKRDLADLAYEEQLQRVDSVYKQQVLETADNRLFTNQLDAYLVFDRDILENGKAEYHALLPGDNREIDALRQTLQDIVIDQRLEAERISPSKRKNWLKPVKMEEVQLLQEGKREFNYYVHYFGPIIIVFLLFIAIFTSSGFLFNGILQEKNNKIIEILISSLTPQQLIAGKILGLGSLGLVQVFFWIGITVFMILAQAMNMDQLTFINLDNTFIFLLYFVLGYFFYAAVYVGIASVFKTEKDAQQVNTFLRLVAIFPVLLAILVLNDPNSQLVRILSFIPFLTPTFMILRVSLSPPPTGDILISIVVMVIGIWLAIRVAARIFRFGILWEGEVTDFRTVVNWMKGREQSSQGKEEERYNDQ